MKIAVISPDRRQGSTTVSILLATAMAETQNMRTCLTYTGHNNNSMKSFLGLKPTEDKTKNLSQVIKLLEANAISGEEMGEYCTRLLPNLQILDTASEMIMEEDGKKLTQFAIDNLTHDMVITDVATEIYDSVTQAVIDSSDLVVMVLTQSQDVWNKLEAWEEEGYMEKLNERGLVFIFDQYDPDVDAFRKTTKKVGIRHRRCAKITYNPFIKRMSNQGNLHNLLPYIIKKDPRVVTLNNDIRECLLVVLSNLGRKTRWAEKGV